MDNNTLADYWRDVSPILKEKAREKREKIMKYPYKKDWWETKDHKKIKISDMETSHIENTIKFLKKHHDFYGKEYEFYDYNNGEIFYNYDDNSYLVDKKIAELQYELDKRNEE